MSAKITANSGSGKIKDDSIFDFSYSEDITPLDPSSSSGGSSQITFSAIEEIADVSGLDHPNTKLLINNNMTLSTEFGNLSFQVKKVSSNAGGAASITGASVQNRLNVIKTLQPITTTLYDAIVSYCAACGISEPSTLYIEPTLKTAMQARSVAFMGWTGNVWDYLKMLCAVYTYNTTDKSNFEMYFTGTALGFRKALSSSQTLEYATDFSESVETFEAAKTVDIYNYNTVVGTNKILYDISNYDTTADPTKVFLSSISDYMTIDSGQTVVKRFNVDVMPTSINQPTCVASISLPYTGGDNGKYVVVGSDDLRILPSEWIAYGGSLTVKTTENPGEIEITVVATPKPTLTSTTGGLSNAPFRVGVETSGNGVDYPALWLTANGTFFNKKVNTFYTGSDSALVSKDAGTTIDNPFITDSFIMANAGIAAAQEICGPSVKVDGALANGVKFGGGTDGVDGGIGRTFTANSNKFRIESINFSSSNVSFNSSSCATFADFDTINSGKTFTQFDTMTGGNTNIAFNEFSVIPLTKG